MGFLQRWWSGAGDLLPSDVVAQRLPPRARFDIGTGDVDPAVFGMTAYSTPIGPVARVSRPEAIQVPAVKKARDLICSTLAGLPLQVLDTEHVTAVSTLLAQPEPNCARSVTMARTYEDMFFEGFAWWRVTRRDFRGYPSQVRRLEARSVQQRRDGRTYVARDGSSQGMTWDWVEDRDLIRFDSPTDAFLDAGARAIRGYLKLAAAADRYADEPMPSGYFEPTEGADPLEDEEVLEVLDDWKTARQTRSTAYVPAALKYNPVQWSPQDLQMGDARQMAVLEIARVSGVDPTDLGVEVNDRPYQNDQARRLAQISDIYGPYATALAERLSMPDVTARGYRVVVDYSGFLRADEKTRLETYAMGVGLGLYDVAAVAEREGLPTPPPRPEPAPAPADPRAVEAS